MRQKDIGGAGETVDGAQAVQGALVLGLGEIRAIHDLLDSRARNTQCQGHGRL
jgi:hypothetical protein